MGAAQEAFYQLFQRKKISLQGITGMESSICDPRGAGWRFQPPKALLGLTLQLQELPVPAAVLLGRNFLIAWENSSVLPLSSQCSLRLTWKLSVPGLCQGC